MVHHVAEAMTAPPASARSATMIGFDRPADFDQAAEIADCMVNLVQLYASIKTKAAIDPETAPLFLLVRLVKDGPKRAKELAEQLNADPSTVSRQVAALVKSGLIERKADPADGRASILVPTEQGVARVQEHYVNRGQAIEPVVRDWPVGDRADLVRLLQNYITNLESRRDDVHSVLTGNHRLHHATTRSEESN